MKFGESLNLTYTKLNKNRAIALVLAFLTIGIVLSSVGAQNILSDDFSFDTPIHFITKKIRK